MSEYRKFFILAMLFVVSPAFAGSNALVQNINQNIDEYVSAILSSSGSDIYTLVMAIATFLLFMCLVIEIGRFVMGDPNIAAKPGNVTRKDISDVQFDHYDQIDGDFSGTKKPVIRTTITWKETEYRADGAPKPSVSRMQRITWTLLDRKEISQKSDDWLRLNPLGIEILTKNEMDR